MKIRIAVAALAFLLGVTFWPVWGPVHAQVTYTPSFNPSHHYWQGRPTVATNVCGGLGCHLTGGIISSHGSSGTVTITDNGVACAGGICTYMDTVTIAANTTYSIPTYGLFCKGGCSITTTGTVDVAVAYTIGYVGQ